MSFIRCFLLSGFLIFQKIENPRICYILVFTISSQVKFSKNQCTSLYLLAWFIRQLYPIRPSIHINNISKLIIEQEGGIFFQEWESTKDNSTCCKTRVAVKPNSLAIHINQLIADANRGDQNLHVTVRTTSILKIPASIESQ